MRWVVPLNHTGHFVQTHNYYSTSRQWFWFPCSQVFTVLQQTVLNCPWEQINQHCLFMTHSFRLLHFQYSQVIDNLNSKFCLLLPKVFLFLQLWWYSFKVCPNIFLPFNILPWLPECKTWMYWDSKWRQTWFSKQLLKDSYGLFHMKTEHALLCQHLTTCKPKTQRY